MSSQHLNHGYATDYELINVCRGGLGNHEQERFVNNPFHQQYNNNNNNNSKKLENWGEEEDGHQSPSLRAAAVHVDVKQEEAVAQINSNTSSLLLYGDSADHHHEFHQLASSNWLSPPQVIIMPPSAASSPATSCVTSLSTTGLLNFSGSAGPQYHQLLQQGSRSNQENSISEVKTFFFLFNFVFLFVSENSK